MSNPDPRVVLLAHTVLTDAALLLLDPMHEGVVASDADHLAEIAGRQCYESWSRPNPKTAANADYLANVIRQQHTSVLAHASFTFRLTGVSRSLTHELIRHRFLAVSEVSQRYVDMSQSYTVAPPALGPDYRLSDHHDRSVELYEELVDDLVSRGATRKQARQAARCVLPGGTETKMIVSGNTRAWIDFVQQRYSAQADSEICEIAKLILDVLRDCAPNSVQHIDDI